MGRRGPAPAPARLKILRGETRPSRVNRHEPQPADHQPVAPADLVPDAVKVWQRVLAEFGHTRVIRAADTDVLRIYCEAVVRYEEAARLLGETGPLIKSRRTGDLVRSPLHQVVRDNATLVRQLAGDLGLSPTARSGLRAAAPAMRDELARFLA